MADIHSLTRHRLDSQYSALLEALSGESDLGRRNSKRLAASADSLVHFSGLPGDASELGFDYTKNAFTLRNVAIGTMEELLEAGAKPLRLEVMKYSLLVQGVQSHKLLDPSVLPVIAQTAETILSYAPEPPGPTNRKAA